MRILGTIILKEMRELLTRKMLLPFFAIMVLFLFIGRAIRGERKKASAPQRALVLVQEESEIGDTIISRLQQSGLLITNISEPKEQAITRAQKENFPLLIVLPESIDERLKRFEPATIETYTVIKGFSFAQTMRGVKIKSALGQINSWLAQRHLQTLAPEFNPENIENPLKTSEYVVLKGRLAPGTPELIQGVVIAQTFLIPIVLLMVIIYASQMIAASIGQEKENKTLETLLTVPISRVSIVLGKMLGAAIAAFAISAIFMGAMAYYTTAFSERPQQMPIDTNIASTLDLNLTPEGMILIGITLFLAILAALALATLLAVFSEDAKSAQAAIAPLMILCLVPYFFTMFFDIQTLSLPLKIFVLAIPFSYPFLVPQALIFGNYPLIIFGLVYITLFAALTVFIAARLFNSDLILTAKLRYRRRR
ncbi:MAG: ABC transporter permease [candidate division WOR-3 bacterium]